MCFGDGDGDGDGGTTQWRAEATADVDEEKVLDTDACFVGDARVRVAADDYSLTEGLLQPLDRRCLHSLRRSTVESKQRRFDAPALRHLVEACNWFCCVVLD